MGLLERQKAIEFEIDRTQKNKATNYHIGRLKGQLARIKTELLENAAKAGGSDLASFEVKKSGDVRVALVGFPSVGKSSFLSVMTPTESEVAAYEFTTLTCVPGKVMYNGTEIQILDLPGIIEGASDGKGRGRQVIATARTSNLVLIMLDASKGEVQRKKIERELEAVGLRLNKAPPNVSFKKKPSCSQNILNVTTTVNQTNGMSVAMVKEILKDYKIHNADCTLRQDITIDEFIDVIEGNRRYIPCVYCYNKIDGITIEEVDRLARTPHAAVCSVKEELGLWTVIDEIWSHLGVIRIFTKRKGSPPEFSKPFVVPSGATVEEVCSRIHADVLRKFKYALVWGTSTRHSPQTVGRDHVLQDEDVVQILLKTANE
jgi:small GTP-binding protein